MIKIKNIFGFALLFCVFSFALYAFFVFAGAEHNLSGWAWSETIGWISFNSANQAGGANYGVTVASNGRLSGYAWSENIGWITFNQNELSGCPSAPCQANFDKNTGQVTGWARALANGGGWDGWISLSGSNYGVTVNQCDWQGWAWGSDVIGWISFRGSNYGVQGTGDACTSFSATLSASPSSGFASLSATLTASVQGGAGTINYTFWWDCNSGTTNVSSAISACGDPNNPSIGAKFDGVSETSKSVSHIYGAAATYTAKVIVERGARAVESRQTIAVSPPPEDFSLQKSNDITASITAAPLAASSKTKITVNPIFGFSSPVGLSSNAASIISGAIEHFSDQNLTSNEYSAGSEFWVDVPRTTPVGSYTVTVTGSGGGKTRIVNVILNVDVITPEFREI